MRIVTGWLLVVVACWALVFMPHSAMAAGGNLMCLPDGSVANDLNGRPTGFFDAGSGPGGACDTTFRGIEHVFSEVACNFISVLNDVLSKVHCSMQAAFKDIIALALSIYVMLFGVQLLMGMTQLNSVEIMVRLLKIAIVWMLVSESGWLVGWVFNFFIDFSSSGVYWALGSIPIDSAAFGTVAPPAAPGDPVTPSTCIGALYQNTNFSSMSNIRPVLNFLDQLLFCTMLAPLANASVGLIGFFLAMSIVVPPLFMLALYWLWSIISVLSRGLLSLLMGFSALAFLITIAPIFLGLMLFKATFQFFENWLKYMISFSLQTIIVFACIALWATTIPLIVGFFTELSGIVFESEKSNKLSSTATLNKGLGICPYDVYVMAGETKPHIQCVKPTFDPLANPGDKDMLTPLAKLAEESNAAGPAAPTCSVLPPGATLVFPDCDSREMGPLIYYVIYHIISLIIISYAFDALLKAAPTIATALAGPEYMFAVGQGFGASGFGLTGKGATQRLKPEREKKTGGGVGDVLRGLGINTRDAVDQFNREATGMVNRR